MSYQLRLSSEAEAGIDEQLEWFESDERRGGIALADRWESELEKALKKLCLGPQRYGFAPENGRWESHLDLRQMQFRPWRSKAGWRVIFVIDEVKLEVTVLQVRHERRLWLSEEE